jgi:hypothetical protein
MLCDLDVMIEKRGNIPDYGFRADVKFKLENHARISER